MKSPIEWGIWLEEPRENRIKITKVRYCGGCEGKVDRGVNRDVGSFCIWQASLLMYALNVDRRCCIVPPIRVAAQGTIENYPRPTQGIAKYPLIWWWGGCLPLSRTSYPLTALAVLAHPSRNAATSSGCPLAPPLYDRCLLPNIDGQTVNFSSDSEPTSNGLDFTQRLTTASWTAVPHHDFNSDISTLLTTRWPIKKSQILARNYKTPKLK